MKNLIKLHGRLIVGKWVVTHSAITLTAIALSMIAQWWVGGVSGITIAWAIVAWIPLLSFIKISRNMEIETIKYIQARIPHDIELCPESELIQQLALRNNGCVGIVITEGSPIIFESFRTGEHLKIAAHYAVGWGTKSLIEQHIKPGDQL